MKSKVGVDEIIDVVDTLEEEEKGVIYNRSEKSIHMDASNYKACLTVLKDELAAVVPTGVTSDILNTIFNLLSGAEYDVVRQHILDAKFKVLKTEGNGSISVVVTSMQGLTTESSSVVWRLLGFTEQKVLCKFFSCHFGVINPPEKIFACNYQKVYIFLYEMNYPMYPNITQLVVLLHPTLS